MVMTRGRIVDRNTVYEREVFIDLDTIEGKNEALLSEIDEFLEKQKTRRNRWQGKTNRHKLNGAPARRAMRRVAHEGWMKRIVGGNQFVQHPFAPHPYVHTNKRDK